MYDERNSYRQLATMLSIKYWSVASPLLWAKINSVDDYEKEKQLEEINISL